MSSSESSQALRDPQQINFVMFNRFWSLSKTLFTLPSPILPILNGQYQAAWNANQKFWEGTSVKSYKIQLPVFLFLVLHQFLYQQTSFLQLSRISLNIIWKKFSSQIIFFKQIHPLAPTPSPYWPKSAKRDKSFLSIFPKMSDEISFFQTFIDKILQSIF